jgi:hypothetical protein
MDNLSSGLRSGAAIGGMIKGGMDTSAVQNAAQRIQAGENQQAVISELMAQSPQAAQQLMNLLGGQQNLDAGATEIEALKTKVGMQSLQQAALPIFGALQVDDDGARGKLLNEAAAVFEKQSPETAAVIRQIGGLQGKQQFDAVAGIVKSLRSAGVFPDDPSQLQKSLNTIKGYRQSNKSSLALLVAIFSLAEKKAKHLKRETSSDTTHLWLLASKKKLTLSGGLLVSFQKKEWRSLQTLKSACHSLTTLQLKLAAWRRNTSCLQTTLRNQALKVVFSVLAALGLKLLRIYPVIRMKSQSFAGSLIKSERLRWLTTCLLALPLMQTLRLLFLASQPIKPTRLRLAHS